ncbi:MAG: hypothetical protein WC301_06905 [Candidatus Omnitrophota bacterium]|jgi:Tfp pilus assembly protein PilX
MKPLITALNRRGVALILVLTAVLIVASLAIAILSFILSHSQLTEHNIKSVKAYYAALSGMNIARDMIRTNTTGWVPVSGNVTKTICSPGCDITDWDIGAAVDNVTIVIWEPYTNNLRKIEVTAYY